MGAEHVVGCDGLIPQGPCVDPQGRGDGLRAKADTSHTGPGGEAWQCHFIREPDDLQQPGVVEEKVSVSVGKDALDAVSCDVLLPHAGNDMAPFRRGPELPVAIDGCHDGFVPAGC
jgi:hypothetical protein